MRIKKFVIGMVGTNCYVVYNENTKECFVVDPAAPSAPLVEFKFVRKKKKEQLDKEEK